MTRSRAGVVWWLATCALALVACGDNNNITPPDAEAHDASGVEGIDPVGPILQISPLTSSFGNQPVGSTSNATTFTVTNLGVFSSGMISASVMGSGTGDFTIASNGCTILAGGATCTIGVTFTPMSAGQKTASLGISANPGGSVSASLDGTGVGTSLAISSSNNAFGNVVIGTTSSTQATFTIANTGGATSGALSVQITGSDPSEFIETDTCNGVMLTPASSCTITASFTPTSTGAKSASIDVSANPGNALTGVVTGTGVPPANLSIVPSPFDYGAVCIGQTSINGVFTVTNVGGVATGVLASSLSGADANQFTLVTSSCEGATLAPQASCTIIARFSPTTVGAKAVEIRVTGAPGGATLLGTGLSCGGVTMSAASPYGSVIVGQTSTAQTLTVTNTGGVSSGLLSTALGGTDPDQFHIVANTCQGVALAGGGQCTIDVVFAPTIAGSASANVSVTGNPGGTATAGLAGTGIDLAGLTISPAPHDFGAVLTNTASNNVPFTIKNVGTSATGSLAQALTGDTTEFTIVTSTCDGVALLPGASCTIAVRFDPVVVGNDTADLSVTAAPGGSLATALFGQGVDGGAGIIANPTFANFGDELAGQTSAVQTITITNTSPFFTGLLATAVIGANPDQFQIVTDACDGNVLPPSEQCSIEVAFAPTVVGLADAVLDLTGTPGGNVTVALAGNGI